MCPVQLAAANATALSTNIAKAIAVATATSVSTGEQRDRTYTGSTGHTFCLLRPLLSGREPLEPHHIPPW